MPIKRVGHCSHLLLAPMVVENIIPNFTGLLPGFHVSARNGAEITDVPSARDYGKSLCSESTRCAVQDDQG